MCHSLFDTNLREVDNGISKIVALFNDRFPDGKTAFIATADHGMSNKGSTIQCLKTIQFNNYNSINLKCFFENQLKKKKNN